MRLVASLLIVPLTALLGSAPALQLATPAAHAAVTVLPLFALVAPPDSEFRWTGRLAADKEIEIKGVNGDIRALAATGREVEVTAIKRGRRSDPSEVRIEVVEHDDGVTICAVYPSEGSRRLNSCESGSGGRMSTRDNDVVVDFVVRVPAGVSFVGRTVNGDVDAEGLASDVEAVSVNGGVSVATSGTAEAETVNGSITATIGRADWQGAARFETVNGGITLTLPAGLDADVEAETVNGDISSDFPLTIKGRFGPRRLNGTIGKGGRELALKTVNGSIRLKRS